MAQRTRPTAPPDEYRRLPAWVGAAAAAVLHLALCVAVFDPGAYIGGDNGTYVALARGLLERGAYVDYWDPAMAPHTLYPPAFPLILAAGLRLGLSVWVGVKALCIAFSVGAVALSALWLRRILPPRPALVVAMLIAAAPAPAIIAGQVLSDVPFWTWTMLALWAYGRAGEENGADRWHALGAVAVILAFFTRIAGLPLVVAAAAWLVLQRQWRGLGMLAGGLAPLAVGWWLRNRLMGGPSAYSSEFWWIHPYAPARGTIGPIDLLLRMWANVVRYGSERIPALFFGSGIGFATWTTLAAAALVLLAVIGWGMRLRRPGVAELFVPLYVGLLLVWPATWSGERFLLPILPALLAYAALTLRAAAARTPAPVVLPALAAAGLLLAMVPGIRYAAALGAECRAGYRRGDPAPCLAPKWSELLSIGPLLRGRLPEGSVVIHRKPTLLFVTSGYRSRLYPKSVDPDTFFAMVRETGADYLVLDNIEDMAPYARAVLSARNRQFCVVTELSYENAILTRIVPDAPPMAAGSQPNEFRTCPATGPAFRNPE